MRLASVVLVPLITCSLFGQSSITIQTVPAGLQFTVDGGTSQTSPLTLNLTQGAHNLAVATPQAGTTGTQYTFASWSDGGAASHSIIVGASAATYTASFNVQYLLATTVSPAGAGAVTAIPSPTGYYNAGASVQLTASANAGYQFSNWGGGLTGSANPQSIIMNASNSVVANFSTPSCSITLNPPAASLPATGTSTVETCPNNSGQPNCGVSPETPLAFTVTPSAACGVWTATSSNPGVLSVTSGASGSGAGTVGFTLLNNTHTLPQTYTITVGNAAASASYTVTEAGSGDSQVYREVYSLYEQILGRDPDPAGFGFWTGSGGAGLGQMADSFLTSPEAFNSDFAVMAAYQAATGAAPTYAQFTAAVTRVRAGAQTVASLFNALIGSSFTATTLYQNLLYRQPSASEISAANAAGFAAWFEYLIGYPGAATPIESANNEFQSTGAYHTTLAADHTNALYVQMIYYVTVGRDPDAAGLAFWIGIANSGGPGVLFQGSAGYNTRIQILGPGTPTQGFIGSPEFQDLFITFGGAAPWVSITSIWSNQLGNGVIANYLPGGSGISTGQYILMGTAKDGTIQAGASIEAPFGIDTSGLTVRLAYVRSDNGMLTAIGTGTLSGATASSPTANLYNATLTADLSSLSPPASGPDIPNFEVVAFQDSNGNGQIDPGENVTSSLGLGGSLGVFKLITPDRYQLALLDLGTMAAVGALLPNASTFLSAFVYGAKPDQATSSTYTVFASQLSHSVGTFFTTGRDDPGGPSGTIPQYNFPCGNKTSGSSCTGIAGAILNSADFNQQILIPAAQSACLLPVSSNVQVRLMSNVTFQSLDPTDLDLFFAFHTATLSGPGPNNTATLTLTPTQASIDGTLSKLYNWDFEKQVTFPDVPTSLGALFDQMGASLQAGFPTMGTGTTGQIFFAVVQLNGPVQVPACPLSVSPADSFSVTGQTGSVSGSMTYTVQDTGSYPIAFTATVDVPWLTLSAATGNLQANASSAVIVSTNAAANSLGPGSYTGEITFSSGGTVATRTATLVITAAAPQIQSLTLSPTSVASGGTAVGAVVLSKAAPAGGVVVSLSASSTIASVPPTVTVSGGATSATFSVTAGTVSSAQSVTITASLGGSSAQAILTVVPTSGGSGPNCQPVTQGQYQFTFWNTLSTDILVLFGDVVLPGGTHASLPFGYQMHPNECDIVGLPVIATYSVSISLADSDGNPIGTVTNNIITVSDTGGISFNSAQADAVIVTGSNCNAKTQLQGAPAYNLCIP